MKNWELRVWSPTGIGPRIIRRDESFIRSSGLRMQITPERDSREASFIARGDKLRIRPLDCVQVIYGDELLFYGEVRVGGNVSDTHGHTYTLRSLVRRLGEVYLPADFSTERTMPARELVAEALMAVRLQLGSSIVIAFDLIQDLGFDVAPVANANFQTALALIEKIVEIGKGYGVNVVYGVNDERCFFIQPAGRDVMTLSKSQLTGATRWPEPVAETPCTAVLWLLYKMGEGKWRTHLSRSSEADVYGSRIKVIALENGLGAEFWENVPLQYHVDPETEHNLHAKRQYLSDGEMNDDYFLSMRRKSAHGREIELRAVPAKSGQQIERLNLCFRGRWEETAEGKTTVHHDVGGVVYLNRGGFPLRNADRANPEMQVFYPEPTTEALMSIPAKGSTAWFFVGAVHEFRAERFKTELLDRWAEYHYKTPHSEPADIEIRTFISPKNLTKYIRLGEYQSIVDAYEYRLTASGGMCIGVLTGQAEDPASLAQAQLIKKRDGEAVVTAVITSLGGQT